MGVAHIAIVRTRLAAKKIFIHRRADIRAAADYFHYKSLTFYTPGIAFALPGMLYLMLF